MAEIQHDHHGLVISVMHVHISHDDCMEMIVLKGAASEVRSLAGALLSLKGVKHGQLFISLQVREMTGSPRKNRKHPHRHSDESGSKNSRPARSSS